MVSSDNHLVCPLACWMFLAASAAARAAHLCVAEPQQGAMAILFQCAEVRLQMMHFHPFSVAVRVCPPSATGLASRMVALGFLVLAAAAAVARRILDCAGHPVASLQPYLFAMTPAKPIHFAIIVIRVVCRTTAVRTSSDGLWALAASRECTSAMSFPFLSFSEMRSGTSASDV